MNWNDGSRERLLGCAEVLLGFGVLPPVLGFFCPPATWIPVLWALALAAAWMLRRETPPAAFCPSRSLLKAEVPRILWRFGLVSVVMLVIVWFWLPGQLFALPRQKPGLWVAVLVLYPLWSVYPQELLFRRWFFHRYAPLFGDGAGIVLASALFFGWAHVVMHNGLAVLLSLGGWLFAQTYRRTRSLVLACLEHALYGDMVFTIGLGSFFFHGAVGRA